MRERTIWRYVYTPVIALLLVLYFLTEIILWSILQGLVLMLGVMSNIKPPKRTDRGCGE